MGVGGKERFRFDARWDHETMLAARDRRCDTASSIPLALLPFPSLAESVKAKLLFAVVSPAFADIVALSEVISSCR